MRVLIVSDTHRMNDNFCKVIEEKGPFNRVIHLGDAEGAEYFLSKKAQCPLDIIAGNNDFFADLPREKEIAIEGRRILMTHGHQYYVSVEMERIRQEGRERGVDIVMFGHTHRPLIDVRKNDISLINPGSLSYPRQDGRQPTYIIMKTDEREELMFELHHL